MTTPNKDILNNTLNLIETNIDILDRENSRDVQAIAVVKGLSFNEEESDSASLRYEKAAQAHIERRIAFFQAEREIWSALSRELYDELFDINI